MAKNDVATRPSSKPMRKRPESDIQVEAGDNARFMAHSLVMWNWESVDFNKPDQVRERVSKYFELCVEDDMKPSVAGMALAFGIDRKRLIEMVGGYGRRGRIETAAESVDILKKAYAALNAQMEAYMESGKINPVAGIFLLKNNMGYADKQEVVLTPNTEIVENSTPEELQSKYLEATKADYTIVNEE